MRRVSVLGLNWKGGAGCGWTGTPVAHEVVADLKRVQTHTMTRNTEAKIKGKMAANWPWNRSPGEFGTALRSISKMLRNAEPNSPRDRF